MWKNYQQIIVRDHWFSAFPHLNVDKMGFQTQFTLLQALNMVLAVTTVVVPQFFDKKGASEVMGLLQAHWTLFQMDDFGNYPPTLRTPL